MDEHLTKAEKKEIRKEERHTFEEELKKQEARNKFTKIAWWIGGIAVVILAVWGLIALSMTPTSSSLNNTITAPKLNDKDITKGPKNAKVTLIEYSDFQCPACAAYHPLVNKLEEELGDKILFVYRFFPLTNIHQNAAISAQAAYAAYNQGKFWEMGDLLFNNQKDWSTQNDPTATFIAYAKQLGLNTNQFQTDMNAQATKDFISAEQDAGTNAGVNATPTFFINGKSMQNVQSYEEFKQKIQDALNK
jgi:protein-disulfide isomerase